jgi:glyoxylase-like metal-dependent hydrolase (beta-lactamase superfamily II)
MALTVRHIPLHYNSVYLVEGPEVRVLVDTGPDYAGSWRQLQEALGAERPDVVVATHGHLDHAGLGRAWQEEGVRVGIGADDAALARQEQDPAEEILMLRQLVTAAGTPAEVSGEAFAGLGRRERQLRAARSDYPPAGSRPRWPTGLRYLPYQPDWLIKDGTGVAGGLSIMACPGHTPGNLVLVEPERGWLFSGDQLLPDITPTPGLQLDPRTPGQRYRSLPAFLGSLKRLAGLELKRCFPGHGQPFEDPGTVIAANVGAIETRTERMLSVLRDRGSSTVYGLCERLYPRAVQRRFWQIFPTVVGHLDLLEERALARQAEGMWEAS